MANIKLNLTADPFSGQIVTFTTPCDCDQVSDGLVINGNTYTVCDAMGNCVTGKGGAWSKGARISVILDCENKKAFILNAAQIDADVKSHNHSASDINSGTFAATDVKAMTGTDYTTYRIRNAAIVSATPSSMSNGDIAFVYS